MTIGVTYCPDTGDVNDAVRTIGSKQIRRRAIFRKGAAKTASVRRTATKKTAALKANCQIAVSLSLANEAASLPVAYRLYLPKDCGG
jgi:SRSO17 transposase